MTLIIFNSVYFVLLVVLITVTLRKVITFQQFRATVVAMLLGTVVFSLAINNVAGAIVNLVLALVMFFYWYDKYLDNKFNDRLKK